ncbi:MlaD family protein [Colibacter massiliensis]|uniref:MlaD family protein n=1 Tax=Colibacter massiliensis TaxID=1852379 RepID=UPI003F926C14
MNKWSAEARVGLMTIIGILLLFFVVVSLAHTDVFKSSGITAHVTFNDANGLQAGNSVRYVGVNVGKVESVAAGKDGVQVTLKLKEGTEIPKDSKAVITTDGLLGEKLVSITPGQDTAHLLTDGGTLTGDTAKSVDDVMDNANKLLNNVNDMMKNVNSVIGDEKTQSAMRGSIRNVEALTGNANDILAANAGNVQQMTANMVAVTGQLNETVQRMDGDGAVSSRMRDSLENIKNITDRFTVVAEKMETIATDPQSSEDIRQTLHNTAQITSKVNHILGGKVEGEAGMLYNDTKNKAGGQANFKVYRRDSFALIGAESIGDGTKLNLQYGHTGKLFDARLGLIRGKFGAGVDLFSHRDFRVSVEGYDPNDWRYRLKAQYRLFPNIFLVGQFTRPMKRNDGGNYYGINYIF